MKNFNQGGGNRFGGNRSGGSRFGGGRPGADRGPVTMHKAICSDCGNSCEVPFRPTGDKPIFCSDCFSAKRGGDAPRESARAGSFGGDRFPRKDFGDRAPRPSFGGASSAPRGDSEVKKQLEFLGMKIDRLTKIVEGISNHTAHTTPEKSAEVKKAIKDATSDKKVVAKEVKASVVKAVAKAPAKTVAKTTTKKVAKKASK